MRLYRSGWIPALLLLLAGPGVTPVALGEIIVFTSESAFLASGRVVSTETFDQFPNPTFLGTQTVTVSGITYTSMPMSRWIAGGFFRNVSPPNALFVENAIDARSLTFGEDQSTDAIGLFLLSGGFPLPVFEFTVRSRDGGQLSEFVSVSDVIYRGFIAPEGITSVSVRNVGTIVQSNFSFDNVSRGNITPIPEPSTFTLLGIGTLGLFGYAWRRRNRAA